MSTIYVGEAMRITAVVTDADTGRLLDPPPSATVELHAPGRNPRTDPTVQTTPDVGPYAG